MKNLISLFVFLIPFLSFSQDIIYTVSGDYNGGKTPLDSILIENLDNNSRIMFRDFPVQDYYQINLTKKTYWGTVGINNIKQTSVLIEQTNTPGMLSISYQGNKAIETKVSIFNINGQLVFSSIYNIYSKNSIDVRLGNSGIYIVKIDTPFETQSFKAVGTDNTQQYEIQISANNKTKTLLKFGVLTNNEDFSFAPGDSIRVSAYKTDLYAHPIGTKIIESESLNFEFDSSTVVTSGISDAYVELDNAAKIIQFDKSDGVTKIQFENEKPDFMPGDVIVVDADTMGYLRKIVSFEQNEDTTIFQTERAGLNDVFVNKSIKIHTGLMTPDVQLKSNSSMKDIEKAFTDENGYIHPYKVIYHNSDGSTFTKSALTITNKSDDRVRLYEIEKDLKMDLYGTAADDVHLYVDEGHLNFFADAVFEFDYDYKGEWNEDTKIKEGELNSFKFYLEGNLDFLSKLALDLKFSAKKEETKKLIDIQKVTQVFYVGIPVWITFDCDIYGYYHYDIDANLHADWGLETNHNVKIGGTYNKKEDTFTPIKEYKGDTEVFPLRTEGKINAFSRVEIYPRSEVKFYDFYGPISEIVPYVEGRYNGMFQTVTTSKGTESFLAWDSNLQLGLDFAVGSELTFLFGIEKSFDVYTYYLWRETIWKTPAHLRLKSELPENVYGSDQINITFQVLDNLYKPVPLCPVYIQGDGDFNKEILISDVNGQINFTWTIGNDKDVQSFTAMLFDSNKTNIVRITKSVNVTIKTNPGVETYEATEITKTSAKLHGNVTSDGGSEITERGFYWSKTDQTPDKYDEVEIVSGTTGAFEETITGLEQNTTYYFRAFATNSEGTSEGDVKSFKTTEDVSKPTVVTNAESDVTKNSAKLHGNVTSDGGAEITERGFYWSKTDQTPDKYDNVEIVSGKTGTYETTISGLEQNTTYYFRAFATNSEGTETGDVKEFTTSQDISAPTVVTNAASGITKNSARLNGNVTSDGGATITQRGFYWSKTDQTPDADDNTEIVSGTTGSFNKTVSGLEANTTYYFCAYATNSQGTSKGTVQSFKTDEDSGGQTGTFTDSRDGKKYKWVKIGNQTWMAENLAYLPQIDDVNDISNTESKYLVYGYNGSSVSEAKATTNYNKHGVLYNWESAKASCPSGWNLPSDDDFKSLESYLGMNASDLDKSDTWRSSGSVGEKLKSQTDWDGNNESGFNAFPSGAISGSGFVNINVSGLFWTKSNYNTSEAWTRQLKSGKSSIRRMWNTKSHGRSVRCIKD